ncbi:hypothetical protein BRPE64_ACDS14850 [Caballeronia insecticola]|uniref:Uncharacterized protein n=2 Tax=Caballeronia insecticola TaxID=758793 RepID=R4WH15_9BURK|nr:hypothetical protein BRPE64_ACDS14850 [Caballeronia insecticola]
MARSAYANRAVSIGLTTLFNTFLARVRDREATSAAGFPVVSPSLYFSWAFLHSWPPGV